MSLKNKFGFIAMLLLLLGSANSWAAGLGGIDLDSYLNQKLNARIQLLGVPVDQVSTVSARLASAGDYRVMGLDQSRLNIPLTFTAKVWRGKAVIEVTSAVPVRDPILQFAVDVSWQRGHLLREYTLFLDPPTVAVAPPRKKTVTRPTVQATANDSRPEVNAGVDKPETGITTAGEPVDKTSSHTAARVSSMQPGEYGPVQSGETLWRIANNWRKQANGTVNQAMVAIVRLNPGDFINGDINRMNQGAILRLPTAEDIANIPVWEANEIVSSQISAWREQSTQAAPPPRLSEQAIEPEIKPAANPAQDKPEKEAEITDDALARVTDDRLDDLTENSGDEAEDGSIEAPDTGGLLELVPPAEEELAEIEDELPGSASGNDFKPETSSIKLENRLSVAEEDLLAAQQQNTQLQDKVNSMQAEIAALREGLNLNDSELAVMQQQMATDSNADDLLETAEESVKPKQVGTRMLEQKDKGLLERWWWLILLILAGGIGFFVYRYRHNDPAESQAETNFLDSIMEKKETAEFKGGDKAQEDSLAADAKKILEVLEQGDTEIEQQFEEFARSEAATVDFEGNAEAETEAVEIRKFLDQVEADKAALVAASDDALDHLEDDPVNASQADSFAGSAEEEILDSLESDDDSDSEQAADNFSEDHIEVKLDLARAYLAMEDKPAAQAILDEIMTLGSERQQLEARGMLDEIE